MAAAPNPDADDPRLTLQRAIDHLDHVLPGQAPILNFVHHNTLHGYQHLDFTEALTKAEQRTGNHGYLSESEFRRLYAEGRIDDGDIEASLTANTRDHDPEEETLPVRRRELDRLNLVYGFAALPPAQLAWQIAENAALTRLQPDLPETVRAGLLERTGAGGEAALVSELWQACLEVLGIEQGTPGTEAGVAAAEALADEFDPTASPQPPDTQALAPTGHGTRATPNHESTRATTGFPHPGPLPEGEGDQSIRFATFTVAGSANAVEIRNPLPLGEGRVRVEAPNGSTSSPEAQGAPALTPSPTQEPAAHGRLPFPSPSGRRWPEGPDEGRDYPVPGPQSAGHGAGWSLPRGEGINSTPLTGSAPLASPFPQEQGLTSKDFPTGTGLDAPSEPDQHIRAIARKQIDRLLDDVGPRLTLRGLLAELTGHDLLEELRPALIRFCASHLDEGLASWSSPDRGDGLYATWRRCATSDPATEPADWARRRSFCERLPEQPLDALMHCLTHLGLAPGLWSGYLERAALELPGWSGIVNWRQHHPGYHANRAAPTALADFLAIRLALECLAAERLCRETWDIAADLTAIRRYGRTHPHEFYARQALAAGGLPEFLADAVQRLAQLPGTRSGRHRDWAELAVVIARWRDDPRATAAPTAHGEGWRLFRLAQHLGLEGNELRRLPSRRIGGLLDALDRLPAQRRGYLWLWAYERHYRDRLFAALAANHGRGRWRTRQGRPAAQIVFCMDDREEGVRRHLEELNPDVETLGAAGFFGVPIHWRGLDDREVTPLCPVVVTPSHEVRELPAADTGRHDRGLRFDTGLRRLFGRDIRRNLATSQVLIDLLAPAVLLNLAAKIAAPRRQGLTAAALARSLVPELPTRLQLSAAPDSPTASPERPRLGFTDAEQADRVTGFLRLIGLTGGFAPLVAIAGHGSASQNNPHLAAYDCGACSGRHGGPNARTFAAMANRPEVRELVAQRGITIPADTWFVGCEHNTCNEHWQWFDLDAVPAGFGAALAALRADLDQALLRSAHERCRRLASAPRQPGSRAALAHMQGRAADFSQARPELGHATNAAALIGRRSVTRGTFLDRRVFLISYDPSGDTDGTILEGILLAAGPVGAGINLEYYFSTVNNERYGCGSKVPHNVTGWFAVMEGGSSDLRTGLPRQMVEIHEAMRLQVVVEAKTEVVTAIYRRQPPLRELIGRGWILLSAIDPDSGALSVFEPDRGFVPWRPGPPPPKAAASVDWYDGHSGPLTPALIEIPGEPCHGG